MVVELPTGTVTLLFTDIEGSTRLLRSLGDDYGMVLAHADWLIDLGPEARARRGRVVSAGTPADLAASSDSLTARHLRTYLERA
jgi:excinuclease UvrABC ATPase subunit